MDYQPFGRSWAPSARDLFLGKFSELTCSREIVKAINNVDEFRPRPPGIIFSEDSRDRVVMRS